jgi:hypothetical protein
MYGYPPYPAPIALYDDDIDPHCLFHDDPYCHPHYSRWHHHHNGYSSSSAIVKAAEERHDAKRAYAEAKAKYEEAKKALEEAEAALKEKQKAFKQAKRKEEQLLFHCGY